MAIRQYIIRYFSIINVEHRMMNLVGANGRSPLLTKQRQHVGRFGAGRCKRLMDGINFCVNPLL